MGIDEGQRRLITHGGTTAREAGEEGEIRALVTVAFVPTLSWIRWEMDRPARLFPDLGEGLYETELWL